MNVLYVALTRAVEGMIILRKPKESIFDGLDMSPMHVGTLHTVSDTAKNIQQMQKASDIVLSDYGTQETPEREDEEEKDYEAILFGTALHYALEMLGGFDTQSLDITMISLQNRFGQELTQVQISEIEKRIRRLIENESFLQLCSGAKIHKEQSLSFGGELKQVDLLLEYEDHVRVIDYKSSKKYALKHQKQVEYYQKAIAKITGKRTEGMLIYLLEDEIDIKNLSKS